MQPNFRFRFIAAPDDLTPYVNTLFAFETDEVCFEDILPAYSAQLIAFGCGSAQMDFGNGRVEGSTPAHILSPMAQAARFRMDGPVRACGISLTTLGWASLAGLPVDLFGHRTYPAAEIVGEELADRIAHIGTAFAAASFDAELACNELASAIRQNFASVLPQHRSFIETTSGWLGSSLNPPVEDLLAMIPLSRRQVQRLAKRYFGKSPSGLVRRYRAIRAATLLSESTLAPEMRAEVLDAFFDQAHMIRDIRHFTGRTPTGLGERSGTVTSGTLDPQGYGVVDLFGGAAAKGATGK